MDVVPCTRIVSGYARHMTDPLPDPESEDTTADEPLEPSVVNPDADGIDTVPS
jgi:hypothetical protein